MDRRSFLIAGASAAAITPGRLLAKCSPAGRFPEPLLVRNLSADGRLRRLRARFTYVDRCNRRWRVPKDWIVDGASIPSMFWPVVGKPWQGQYVSGSVVHDYECDRRIHLWEEVHRLFHEAMLAAGVPPLKANAMYLAVYYGGPRWTWQTVQNNRMAAGLPPLQMQSYPPEPVPPSPPPPAPQNATPDELARWRAMYPPAPPPPPPPPPVNPDTLRHLVNVATAEALSPQQIEWLVERSRPAIREE
ncbi:MAG TPA: DUF1353 domain-containing protein [Allosphingosinicella sp.]|nr:DUF1353 domain-containing protein [Allosphingosinicella sp.]